MSKVSLGDISPLQQIVASGSGALLTSLSSECCASLSARHQAIAVSFLCHNVPVRSFLLYFATAGTRDSNARICRSLVR